jgi:hypothetical protein
LALKLRVLTQPVSRGLFNSVRLPGGGKGFCSKAHPYCKALRLPRKTSDPSRQSIDPYSETLDSGVQTVHSAVLTVHFAVQTIHSAVQTVHFGVQTVHSGVQTVHSDVQTVHFAPKNRNPRLKPLSGFVNRHNSSHAAAKSLTKAILLC